MYSSIYSSFKGKGGIKIGKEDSTFIANRKLLSFSALSQKKRKGERTPVASAAGHSPVLGMALVFRAERILRDTIRINVLRDI